MNVHNHFNNILANFSPETNPNFNFHQTLIRSRVDLPVVHSALTDLETVLRKFGLSLFNLKITQKGRIEFPPETIHLMTEPMFEKNLSVYFPEELSNFRKKASNFRKFASLFNTHSAKINFSLRPNGLFFDLFAPEAFSAVVLAELKEENTDLAFHLSEITQEVNWSEIIRTNNDETHLEELAKSYLSSTFYESFSFEDLQLKFNSELNLACSQFSSVFNFQDFGKQVIIWALEHDEYPLY